MKLVTLFVEKILWHEYLQEHLLQISIQTQNKIYLKYLKELSKDLFLQTHVMC